MMLRDYSRSSQLHPVLQTVRWKGVVYTFKWQNPEIIAHSPLILSEEDILKKVTHYLKNGLPETIFSGKEPEVLGCSKHVINMNSDGRSIWIVEYAINDDSPVAGLGYPPTLFVPVSLNGQILMDITKIQKNY